MMAHHNRANGRAETPRNFYYTGRSLKARWYRFRLHMRYRRPVTYKDLRKIAHDLTYRNGDFSRPDPAGEALMDLVIRQAERPFLRR